MASKRNTRRSCRDAKINLWGISANGNTSGLQPEINSSILLSSTTYKIKMLYLIKSFTDSVMGMLSEDPVRPHIPHVDRVGDNKDIFVLRDPDDKVKAITCVSYQTEIPTKETELFQVSSEPIVAIFYTIWSYAPGAGRTLIFDAVRHIKENKPEIQRYVTLSPKTEMARRFHLRNGAVVFRENEDTVNYEYHRVIL